MKREYEYIEQLIKGVTEPLLLYLINEVPTYGYNIIKELEKRTTGYFNFKGGDCLSRAPAVGNQRADKKQMAADYGTPGEEILPDNRKGAAVFSQ
jgi:hypothetical protein